MAEIESEITQNKTLEQNVAFYDIEQEPFRICGLMKEGGKFRRIPEKVAQSVTPGVVNQHVHTAGGRVRFVTDSSYIAVHAELTNIGKYIDCSVMGSIGMEEDAGT